MLGRSFLCATLLSLGCSSSDFDVPADNDAATNSDTDLTSETGGDTAIGPCDPEPDKAKYCIEVKLAKPEHPPYNTASGASGLGIDGIGRVFVVLWDKDPYATPPGSPEPEPKYVIPYPSETGEINIDKDLPITVAGSVPPGTYAVASLFADNLTATRLKGDALPGDFVVLPNVVAGKSSFPKLTLELGQVQKTTLELRPNRRVSVTLGIDPTFLTYAKTNPSIHGDGPTMFAIFDGSAGETSGFLHVAFSKCVATKLQQTVPNSPIIDFTTTVEGDHNVQMALFDYTSEPFPGKGTITSTPVAPYPRVSLRPDSWTTSTVVDLVKIPLGPYATPPVDPLKCD